MKQFGFFEKEKSCEKHSLRVFAGDRSFQSKIVSALLGEHFAIFLNQDKV